MIDHSDSQHEVPPNNAPQSKKQRFMARLQAAALPVGLTAAVLIAFGLTVLSVSLYSSTGANRLDLSRPGFERERTEVRKSEPHRTYDTTSPVTPEAIDDFLAEYDQRLTEINEYAGFANQKVLDDSALNIEAAQPVQ